ncbi:PREDICTED: anthrax toxin receptor-like [Dipodomys ordii]|uniref:Anthrax toxin receptor-like n=1 Tax=Dipodomys ordii TaxID=10020 RepID=A0A1S3GVX8_DIPOR|nr:PREDICTED: anthrax toxin receptor-like [Dipodomys ordii]
MGSHNLQVPCSALFLLLILQLLPRGRADGLKYKGPGWKILHRLGLGRSSNTSLQSNVHSCRGVFDLYFILDKSGSVDNNWFEIYSFVENLVKKFQNSRVRISFILYSTDATVLMPLTSDRQEIRQGLNKLQQVVPVGHTYMQEGFKKAIHQIEDARSLGNVSSVIIALTDGTLLPDAFEATKEEAHKARKLGSIIYTVGVLEYNRDQLLAIADTPEHMFGVQNGFKGLQSIVDSLAARSCVEARSVELTTLCAGEPYEVIVSGHGFQNAKHPSLIVCRFKFNNNILVPGRTVIVQISLNNGITFLGNQISYSNIRCCPLGPLHLQLSVCQGASSSTTTTSSNGRHCVSLLLHSFSLPPDISMLFTQDPGQRHQLCCHEPQLHTGPLPYTDLPPTQNYQAKYTRTPSKTLPLLSPQARKSGEFPYCPYPYRSTSDGSKT